MVDLEKSKITFFLLECDKPDRPVTILTELSRLLTTKMRTTKMLNPASGDVKML